jgi:DNA repair exonuclease SbcCD ATPase subunit
MLDKIAGDKSTTTRPLSLSISGSTIPTTARKSRDNKENELNSLNKPVTETTGAKAKKRRDTISLPLLQNSPNGLDSPTRIAIARAAPLPGVDNPKDKKKYQRALRELAEVRTELAALKKESETKIAALQSTNVSLQRQVSNAQQEKDDLRSQLSTVETQLVHSTETERICNLKIKQLEKDKAELLVQLETEIREKEAEKEKALQLVVNHGVEITMLREVLEQKLNIEKEEKHQLESKILENEGAQEQLIAQLEKLKTELAEVEQSQKADQQLATLNLVKEAFEAQLVQYKKTNQDLTEHVEMLEKQLFVSLTLAIKLSRSLSGEHCNRDTTELFEEATRKRVSVWDWSSWLGRKLKNPSKPNRQSKGKMIN